MSRRAVFAAPASLPLLILLAACSGQQNVLDPAGPQAHRVSGLWSFMLPVALAVYALVIAALAYAVARSRRRRATADTEDAGAERKMTLAVGAATGVTVLILLIFLLTDFAVGRALFGVADRERALVIDVTGHQWWWDVSYGDPTHSRRVRTANEIHIPTGRPVLVKLSSVDVIHSFWVPNLSGKKDMVPGHRNAVWFQADTPGVYRGQCAEFCGHQHANMAFLVVAQPPEEFAAWYERQLREAPPPTDSITRRGQEVFLSAPCVMCHQIQGTSANGHVGPNLTHLASRRTIAAGTLPNTRGNLAGWILDPQRIKPGSHMPPTELGAQDLDALLAYLETLK